MNIFVAFVLLLVNMPLSRCCAEEGQLLLCSSIPTAFPPGFSTLLMLSLRDVGQINSTMLSSDNLSSVSRLRMEGAGVTAVADGAFSSLQNLKNLSLNQNLLTAFSSNWFARPNTLVELDLVGNQIKAVTPSMLSGFSALRTLNLSRNRIREIRTGSFSSLDVLSQLDLSGNRMTQVSPQVFSSLTSTRIRLGGNPWNCSCDAEQFVDFLKANLRNQSRLDREEEVTCGSPASLHGLPVWNVSVCMMSTPPTSARQPATTSRPNSVATTVLHFSAVSLTSSASSQIETSVSVGPSDLTTHTLTTHTGSIGETCATSQLVLVSTNTIYTVVAVLVFLCFLLLACVLWLLFWRKRNKKTVTPRSPTDSERESTADGSISSPAQQSDGEKEPWDSEVGWRSFAGVRTVKSAHAALCTSPFGAAAVKESATVQTDAQPRATEKQGKQEEGREIQDGVEIEMENENNIPGEATLDIEDLHKGSESAGITNDTLPYLSIGMNLGDADEQPAGVRGQRATVEKVMRRISTWPPAAVEWQARRKRVQEEEGGNVLDVWPPEVTVEVEKAQSSGRRLEKKEGGGVAQREDEKKISDAEPDVTLSHIPKPPDEGASALADVKPQKEETHRDLASGGQTSNETPNPTARGFARAAKPEKSVRRNEATVAEKRGVTPNDETLLSGNEYVFVDLLHEVVQNKGRWTRERWRQTHTSKPGWKEKGTNAHLK